MDPKNAKTSDRQYYLFALRIVGDFGAAIAVPVVMFVLIGKWLDRIYEKKLLFTAIAFILAAFISGRIIYKKARRYGKEYQNLVEKNK